MSELMLTQAGKQAIAAAIASGQPLQIAQVVAGDGGIASWAPASPQPPVWQPDATLTALPGERWRGAPVSIRREGSEIIVEAIIPPDVGGWWLHATGLIDSAGDLIAVAALQPTYVSTLRELRLGVRLVVSATSAISLQVQPEALVSRNWLQDYTTARGLDLFTNGTCLLGNTYNWPAEFSLDQVITPSLPGAAVYQGYYPGVVFSEEYISVDPHDTYRLSIMLREADYAHLQYVGLVQYDIDGNIITASTHMRYHHNGIDSLTTLSQPLSPGDTVIHVADASGWNETNSSIYFCGVIIFEYKNSKGYKYDYYSRIFQFDMFDLSGVDKANNTITLKTPFPASLANPDDPNGTWPVGTRIANSSSGATFKYAFLGGFLVPSVNQWCRVTNWIGGVDTSGKNESSNFAPGVARVKVLWVPTYSNRPGGYGRYPDSGPDHKVWFSGCSIVPEPNAKLKVEADGHKTIYISRIKSDFSGVEVVPANRVVETLE